MSDYKSHGNAPIEFCGDQEGWIAVGSLSDDSPNSPCFPRSVLLGVGLGPAGKMHPSNIAAMLTIAQATDLRTRLTEAMAVDRPAPTPTPAPGLDLDAVERAERAMTPGPWAAKIYTTHVAGTSQETQWHEAIAGGPSSGTVVCETEWSVFEDESAIGAANIRGIVALRNAAPALIAEVRALRAAAEEREADMHARIRAGYDKTVADAWRAEVAKRDAEIARLRALGLEACDVAIDSAPVATPTRIEEIRKELTRG